MKYVLDASVALKWAFDEPHAAEAISLREAFKGGIHELLSPDLFPVEIAHALSKAHRLRKISEEQAQLYLADILSTAPRLVSSFRLLPAAYQLSLEMRVSLYDCLYLALAEREQCEVITADSKLGKIKGLPVVQLSDVF